MACVWLFLQKGTAQPSNVEVSPKRYDFGEVIHWNNPPAIFTITNKSNKPLLFLPTFSDQEIRVELPDKGIAPNASAQVKVFYYTPLPGSFQRAVQLYVSISDSPLLLNVQGDIVSLSPDALINCPDFSHKTFEQQQSFDQELIVVDETYKMPIPNVDIKILGNNAEYVTKTNKEGKSKVKLMIGLHDFLYGKKGFEPELKIFYLNKNTGELTLTLKADSTDLSTTKPIEITEAQKNPDYSKPNKLEANLPLEPFTLTDTKPSMLPAEKYVANNLVFLVDASGSMRSVDKMPVLKIAILDLVEVLRNIDKLSLITYAIESEIKFSGITADNKTLLKVHIDSLKTKGWTNGVKGLERAYDLAEAHYSFLGNNQVILATDGIFNSPNYDEQALFDFVKRKTALGIKLSIIGFGDDKKAIRMMKKMAFIGKGNYIHLNEIDSSVNPLIEEIKLHSQK